MVHPALYVLLMLAGFTVQLTCAQSMALQSEPLPVIEGKINGMDVVAQGDSVAFFAGQLPGEYSDESCAEDLHCTMHKNHTRAVMLSPEGIRLLQLSPGHLDQVEDEEGDDLRSPVLPSMTLNTLDSYSSLSFNELFIPTEEIEPTPTLATLYTGNPLIDQTPGVAWINSETIKLLATTVETVNLLPTLTSSSEFDEFSLINPSPTEIVKVMTTITGELDELRRRLLSSASVPVATPVQNNNDDPELESDEIRMEMEFDVLRIRPSPVEQYGNTSKATSALTYSVKQAGTTSDRDEKPTSSASDVSTSTEKQSENTIKTPTATEQATPPEEVLSDKAVLQYGAIERNEATQSLTLEYDSLYQKTSRIESERLVMTHFNDSEEELYLVRLMNLEFIHKVSKWTPLNFPGYASDETLICLIRLEKLRGGFFSRIWVIRDKRTMKKIGILITSGLSDDGLSTVDCHIFKDFTGKGLGSEALMSIFRYYQCFNAMQLPEINKHILKARIQDVLFKLSVELLSQDDLEQFKTDLFSGDYSDLFKITRAFPDCFAVKVRHSLRSLNEPAKRIRHFSGFKAVPVSEAGVRSLIKCEFVEFNGQYRRYCET